MFSPRNGCITSTILFAIAHELDNLRHIRGKHGQTTENEENHKKSPQSCLRINVTIANR